MDRQTDRHTHGCSALLTTLTAALAPSGLFNAFLQANNEPPVLCKSLSKGLKTQSQRLQVHTKTSSGDPKSSTGRQIRLGDILGAAVRICGSDSSPRSRFSQGSQPHGLSNKGNGIRSTKCLCEEQNCAKRLKLSQDFVTGAEAR